MAGAFAQTVEVAYRQLLTDQNAGDLLGIGHTYELTAVDAVTGESAELAPGQTYSVVLQYADAELGSVIEQTLALYAWDDSQWVTDPSSSVAPASNTITATPDHLSLWAALGETHRVYLPLVVRNH